MKTIDDHPREGLSIGDTVKIGGEEVARVFEYYTVWSMKKRTLTLSVYHSQSTRKLIRKLKKRQPLSFVHASENGYPYTKHMIRLRSLRLIRKIGWIYTAILVFDIIE